MFIWNTKFVCGLSCPKSPCPFPRSISSHVSVCRCHRVVCIHQYLELTPEGSLLFTQLPTGCSQWWSFVCIEFLVFYVLSLCLVVPSIEFSRTSKNKDHRMTIRWCCRKVMCACILWNNINTTSCAYAESLVKGIICTTVYSGLGLLYCPNLPIWTNRQLKTVSHAGWRLMTAMSFFASKQMQSNTQLCIKPRGILREHQKIIGAHHEPSQGAVANLYI